MDISPSDNDVIPVVLDLQDDSIVEPTELYQLIIVNVSDPNVLVGEVNIKFIIVNDDDDGKIWHVWSQNYKLLIKTVPDFKFIVSACKFITYYSNDAWRFV